MRIFEIIILLLVTILPFVKRPVSRHMKANHILLILGGLFLLHLGIEGWRWQMIPAYVLMLILAWRVKATEGTDWPRLSFGRIMGYIGLVILIFISWLLPMVLPVFTLPTPTGQYTVGTKMIYEKTEMDEPITKDPSDKRELMYKIWYPSDADVSKTETEKYVDQGSRSGFATKYGLPPAALNYLDLVKTHIYQDISVAKGQFPVLIFSHGYGSKATGYYALLTELASQGYVIINMNHTYESLGATFPDGTIKYFDYEFQLENSQGSMEVMQPLIDAFKNKLTYEKRHPIVREAVLNFYESKNEDRWADDIIFTINQLEKWNAAGLLKDKMELNKLGVFGHSNGGGVAGKVALKDSRVKAAANLDGIQWGDMIDSTYQIPFLYISADWPAEHQDINSHIYINKSTDLFYETKVLCSGHPNFMDIPFMIPVKSLAGTGEIDPYVGIEIITKLVGSFFDKHVKNDTAADPEKIGKQYEQLELKVFRGDSIR